MESEESKRRTVLWREGVLTFSMPTMVLVWAVVVVDQVGWSGLWSFRGLLGLAVGLAVSVPLGLMTGAVFWWLFYRKLK